MQLSLEKVKLTQTNKIKPMIHPIKTELVDCPCCRSQNYQTYDERVDLDWQIPGKWKMVECCDCDLIYLNPRPIKSEFYRIYPNNYVPYQMVIQSKTRWLMKKAIIQAYEGGKLNEIKKCNLTPNAKILDIGSGAGAFLTLLKEESYQAVGIEPNKMLVNKALEEDLDVRCGTLKTVDFKDETFDAITLWHSLEHDPEPHETIKKCFKILNPGGKLILQVPDFNSKEALRFKNYFWGNDIPRHLLFFTKKSLIKMVTNNSFALSEIHNTKNTTSWVWALLNYLKITWYTQMEKNIGKIIFLYLMLSPFHYLLSKGDWLTATFTKK